MAGACSTTALGLPAGYPPDVVGGVALRARRSPSNSLTTWRLPASLPSFRPSSPSMWSRMARPSGWIAQKRSLQSALLIDAKRVDHDQPEASFHFAPQQPGNLVGVDVHGDGVLGSGIMVCEAKATSNSGRSTRSAPSPNRVCPLSRQPPSVP